MPFWELLLFIRQRGETIVSHNATYRNLENAIRITTDKHVYVCSVEGRELSPDGQVWNNKLRWSTAYAVG